MRVLLLHNRYQQPGGEDAVRESERRLLTGHGHVVVEVCADNASLEGRSGIVSGVQSVWSVESHRAVAKAIRESRPDLMHAHNFHAVLSPSVYYAASAAGIPVVQTVHNFRLVCPAATLFRRGAVCEECFSSSCYLPALRNRCYRQDRKATAAVAAMLWVHSRLRTWRRKVTIYIALTEFARRKLIEGGLPAERIVVKPNSAADDSEPASVREGFALFVGRLTPEKGIHTLLEACRRLPEMKVIVVGDGPLAEEVRAAAESLPGLSYAGRQTGQSVRELMRRAAWLVVPSTWYEGFPLVVAEAFAAGLPVIASRLGSLAELVKDGQTGLLFHPGNSEHLAATMRRAMSGERELEQMRLNARREYELYYTAEMNYRRLLDIYQQALERHRREIRSADAST
jgi:glycosyltransferase involved in cell wall biosynthesis